MQFSTILISATMLASCGSASSQRALVVHTKQGVGKSVTPLTVSALDPGYEPESLAVAGDGKSVWYWGAAPGDVRLFRWDVAGQSLDSWTVADGVTSHSGLGYSTLAVADSTVWLGVNGSIIAFDTETQKASAIAIPDIADNKVAESHRPPEIQGAHPISAVAVDGSGHLAIAISASATVKVLDTATGAFTDIALPENTEPWNVRYFADGTLAVALADYASADLRKLLLVTPAGKSSVVSVDDAAALEAGTNDTLVVGDQAPDVVDSAGRIISKVDVPSGMTLALRANGALPLADGWALFTQNELVETDNSGTEVASYTYPTNACSLPALGAYSPSSVAAHDETPCSLTPTNVAAGANGQVWLIDRGGADGAPRLSLIQ